MYTQQTGPCDECDGKGETIDKAKMCKPCNGKKVQKEKKKLKVEIDKGAPNGERYTIHGEADEIPDAEAGDVVVQIKEKPHKTFKRRGADLILEKEISLLEALTGIDFVLVHLDGRKIRIKNTPGEIIKHDDLKTVEHLGMPLSKKTYAFGNLFINFKVKFPSHVEAKSIALIHEALGSKTTTPTANNGKKSGKNSGRKKSNGSMGEEKKEEDVDETVLMKAFDEAHRNTHHGGGTSGNDSEEEDDEDGHQHGQKIGC